MDFFKPEQQYASKIPGTTQLLIFDCQAVLVHPSSGRRCAQGFVRYEGTGFWRDTPVSYRSFSGWEPYKGEGV